MPRSVRISEAPSHGQTVMTYDPNSSGALSYLEAAVELAERRTPPRPLRSRHERQATRPGPRTRRPDPARGTGERQPTRPADVLLQGAPADPSGSVDPGERADRSTRTPLRHGSTGDGRRTDMRHRRRSAPERSRRHAQATAPEATPTAPSSSPVPGAAVRRARRSTRSGRTRASRAPSSTRTSSPSWCTRSARSASCSRSSSGPCPTDARTADGASYELIMGERRWRASQRGRQRHGPGDHQGHRGRRPPA